MIFLNILIVFISISTLDFKLTSALVIQKQRSLRSQIEYQDYYLLVSTSSKIYCIRMPNTNLSDSRFVNTEAYFEDTSNHEIIYEEQKQSNNWITDAFYVKSENLIYVNVYNSTSSSSNIFTLSFDKNEQKWTKKMLYKDQSYCLGIAYNEELKELYWTAAKSIIAGSSVVPNQYRILFNLDAAKKLLYLKYDKISGNIFVSTLNYVYSCSVRQQTDACRIIARDLVSARGLYLDSVNRNLFVVDHKKKKINKIKLNDQIGDELETAVTVISSETMPDIGDVFYMCIDNRTNTLIWSEFSGKIKSSSLNNLNKYKFLFNTNEYTYSISLMDNSTYFIKPMMASAATITSTFPLTILTTSTTSTTTTTSTIPSTSKLAKSVPLSSETFLSSESTKLMQTLTLRSRSSSISMISRLIKASSTIATTTTTTTFTTTSSTTSTVTSTLSSTTILSTTTTVSIAITITASEPTPQISTTANSVTTFESITQEIEEKKNEEFREEIDEPLIFKTSEFEKPNDESKSTPTNIQKELVTKSLKDEKGHFYAKPYTSEEVSNGQEIQLRKQNMRPIQELGTNSVVKMSRLLENKSTDSQMKLNEISKINYNYLRTSHLNIALYIVICLLCLSLVINIILLYISKIRYSKSISNSNKQLLITHELCNNTSNGCSTTKSSNSDEIADCNINLINSSSNGSTENSTDCD